MKEQEKDNAANHYKSFEKFLKNSGYHSPTMHNQKIQNKSIVQRVSAASWTFTKDVVLGSALLTTAIFSVGLMGITGAALTKGPSYHYTAPEVEAQRSPEYRDFIGKLNTGKNLKESIQALKDKGLLQEQDREENYGNRAYQTPLMKALTNKNLDAVKLLVEAGADVNFKNKHQQNALTIFMPVKYPRVIQASPVEKDIAIMGYLVSHGLDWKDDNFSILKETANNPLWRAFWIDYLDTHAAQFLPTYAEILKSSLTAEDIALHKTLTEVTSSPP